MQVEQADQSKEHWNQQGSELDSEVPCVTAGTVRLVQFGL